MRRTAALLALVMVVGTCFAGGADHKPGNALLERQFAAWNAHDPEKLASLFTDDVVYEDVTFGQIAHGREELKKMAAGFFAAIPDMHLEIVSFSQHGNEGSVEWVFSGTDVGLYKTGKKFSVHGASRYQLRDGKFSANKDFYDAATIMRQVGALPAAR